MRNVARRGVFALLAVVVIAATTHAADPAAALRAYPDPIPPDATFDMVAAQPFPAMKYPVAIIGWKEHPEEVHVTPAGGLVFPREGQPGGLYLSVSLGPAGAEPAPPDADAVATKLVDGYMPGVESVWTRDGVELRQLVFGSLLEGTTVKTGREPLLAVVRHTVVNKADQPRQVTLGFSFGQAIGGHNLKLLPPVYPSELSFEAPFVREPGGAVAACLLGKGAKAAFQPLAPLPPDEPVRYTVLNADEATVESPEYTVEVSREADAIQIGQWRSEKGADLHYEGSRVHGLAVALDVEVAGADGKVIPVGKLYRGGLSAETRPAEEYVLPRSHSGPIPWSVLSKHLPQGRSKLVARCYYPVGTTRTTVGAWQPILYFSEPGVVPRFKYRTAAPDENRLRVDLALGPGQSRSVDLVVPYFPLAREQADTLARVKVEERLATFREFWGRELNRNAQFVVPEPRIRDAYRACLAYNLLLTDRDPKTGLLMPHPDATAYEYVWAGDSGVIVQAMDRLGYHAEAQAYLDYFLDRQGARKPDGEVESGEGFFSGDAPPRWMCDNGFVLWAMAEHYKLTANAAWLRRVAPNLIKGCDWIIRERARTKKLEGAEKPRHFGLLPKGAPSDIGTWDYWYWTDTYSYMGLRGTADALADIGMKDEAARLSAEADDYRACIRDSLDRSINRDAKPPFVPPSPYLNGMPTADLLQQTWYTISSPIYMVEAGLIGPRDPEAGWIGEWLERLGLYTGLSAFGPGGVDPHYVYNQSLSQLLRGETDKFVWTFYSLAAYGQSRGTYATIECQNLVTGSNGDAWDANRQPHMHSNSRFLDMVRIALVLEEGDTLHLLAGTPTGWLAPGKQIEVKSAPTYFGPVSLKAESDEAAKKVQFTVEPPTRRPADLVLHVRPPSSYGAILDATVNGKRGKHGGREVPLGRATEKVLVICTFR